MQESIEEHLEWRRKRGEHRIEEEHLECKRRRGEHRIVEHRERISEGGHGPPRFSEVE